MADDRDRDLTDSEWNRSAFMFNNYLLIRLIIISAKYQQQYCGRDSPYRLRSFPKMGRGLEKFCQWSSDSK